MFYLSMCQRFFIMVSTKVLRHTTLIFNIIIRKSFLSSKSAY